MIFEIKKGKYQRIVSECKYEELTHMLFKFLLKKILSIQLKKLIKI